jgi:unspecific monooxygenase
MGLLITIWDIILASPVTSIVTLLISLLTFQLVIYPFLLNPIASLPGPSIYKISSIFALNDQRVESRNEKLNGWHAEYGPVVQISPNEVSLSSVDHLKRIYVKHNMPKSTFYAQFTNFGERNAFSFMEKDTHLKRKKIMTKLYTKTAVFAPTSQDHINGKMSNLLKFVQSSLDAPMDVYELFNSLAMDVVTYYELGSKFTTNLLLDMRQRKIIEAFRASSSMWFWTTLVPSLWDWAADLKTSRLSSECREWARSKFLEAYEDLEANGDTNEPSLVRTLYSVGVEKWAIGSEVFDHVAAGHETTGTSLAFATWELSRPMNAHIQQKVCDEMNHRFGDSPLDSLALDEVDKLPYLEAVILETTRLHAAIPGSEPRIINDEYEVQVGVKTVQLPKGTIVSVQPWSVHKNPDVFVHPGDFIPERWLQQSDETLEQFQKRLQLMKSCMFAFGQGNRMCLGMNVAMTEMKLCIGQLYWRYNSKISPKWCQNITEEPPMMGKVYGDKRQMKDVELMSMADSYTSRPIFDECFLEWSTRQA